MRKGTVIILVLLALIAGMVFSFRSSRMKETSVNSAGVEVPVAANESSIQTARLALSWDSVKYGTIYYYYIDGRPEDSNPPGTSDMAAMPGVTEEEAILAVQGSLKKGAYRIIALRAMKGEALKTCPYVVNGELYDNAFG